MRMFLDPLARAILKFIRQWERKDVAFHGNGVPSNCGAWRGAGIPSPVGPAGDSLVAGTEVGGGLVGGSTVGGTAVGGTSVGGTTVVGTSVGGSGVRVGGTGVLVGGTGVLVGAGRGVFVRGGMIGAAVASRGRRVLVGVIVTKRLGVSEGMGVSDAVFVGTIVLVAVGTNWVTDCSVSATAVFKFATARSTIFKGISVAGI